MVEARSDRASSKDVEACSPSHSKEWKVSRKEMVPVVYHRRGKGCPRLPGGTSLRSKGENRLGRGKLPHSSEVSSADVPSDSGLWVRC